MAQLGASASEVHGVICGLICGGINVENGSWYGAFNDLMNNGLALPIELKKQLTQLFDNSCNEFIAGDYQVKLLLADDEQALSEQAKSLAQWSESFMAGFALGNESGKTLSKEVKEALRDLSQISQIDTDIENNEESARSLDDITEYVRMSAMMCHSELGYKPAQATKNKKVH